MESSIGCGVRCTVVGILVLGPAWLAGCSDGEASGESSAQPAVGTAGAEGRATAREDEATDAGTDMGREPKGARSSEPQPTSECLSDCRRRSDRLAISDCGDAASRFHACAAKSDFLCSALGNVGPDPADQVCGPMLAEGEECYVGGRAPPRAGAPASAPSDGSRDGLWSGVTAAGWRVGFVIRDMRVSNFVVYLQDTTGSSFSGTATCVYPLQARGGVSAPASSQDSFEIALISSTSLYGLATPGPKATARFESATEVEGEITGIDAVFVLCGSTLELRSSSTPARVAWTATWRGPADAWSECEPYCAAAASMACEPNQGVANYGQRCARDADCEGGTCVELETVSGIAGCWNLEPDLSCALETRPSDELGWSTGYCSPTCLSAQDCQTGGVDGACILSRQSDVLVWSGAEGNLCVPSCDDDGSCPGDLSCVGALTCSESPSSAALGHCLPCPAGSGLDADAGTP